MGSDPNALQNAEAQKGVAFDTERNLRQQTEKVRDALKSLPDDDRRRVLADALRELNSGLDVQRRGGG